MLFLPQKDGYDKLLKQVKEIRTDAIGYEDYTVE